MLEVLEYAHQNPFKTKSNFARDYADMIAAAASEGFLTTKIAEESYLRVWMITPKGLSYLYALQGKDHE